MHEPPADPVEPGARPFLDLNVEDLSSSAIYKLLVGSVVPRPIAWVSTVDRCGVKNLAPFSFFTVVSREPPLLGFSIGAYDRVEGVKDTLRNIRERREFVVAIPSADLIDEVALSAAQLAPEVSEFDHCGLASVSGGRIETDAVARAPINMECVLQACVEVGDGTFVVGRVVAWRIRPSIFKDGKIALGSLSPLGRLSGPRFSTAYQTETRVVPQDAGRGAKGNGWLST